MILNSMTLKSYRSFGGEETLDFNPRFTVIVGPNEIGKTNILKAIQ
jgi:AAA15 family ATPase/GTPase